MANECIPFYDDGDNITGAATAAVTGCRFLKISAARVATTGGVNDGLISVAPAGSGDKVCGVAAFDAPSGGRVGVVRGACRVVPVLNGASPLTAGTEVQSGAAGVAVALASGKAAGYVIDDVAANGIARVSLYS